MPETSSTDLNLVARIADAGGLSAAARQLALSPASVSARLADIERRLGAVLFRRSTRSLQLTQEGERYLALARPALDLLQAAEDAVRGVADPAAMTGSVRVSAPVDLGRQHIVGMLDGFMEDHPHVRVALLLTDEVTNLSAQHVDLAIRYGDMPSTSGTTATTLAGNRRLVCGAPTYLDGWGRPKRPDELRRHNCLCLQTGTRHLRRWTIGGETVAVGGDRSSNDGGLLRTWAIEGRGLILKSWWDVRDDLAAGRLEELFPDQRSLHPLRLVRPSGRDVPLRVSRLAEHLRSSFHRLPAML